MKSGFISVERIKISSTNIRLETTVPQKEETFQVIIDLIKNSTCFKAFTISADVPKIFMHNSGTPSRRTILNICPRVEGEDFTDVPDDEIALTFLLDLGYKGLLNRHNNIRVVKKKVTLFADDNIISDDPDVALELAKSISKTEAEEAEAARKVHDTHANEQDRNMLGDDENDENDDDVEMKDNEVDESDKGEEKVTDAAKEDAKKTLEAKDDAKKTELSPSSSSLSVSSSFGDQFLKLSSDSSLVSTVKDSADTDVRSLLDIPIQQETPQTQSPPV
ncbi:hypothetical protein Tco_0706311 [Tanacetum coccineum]|uniref:Uncharacterized protein n=1 Tax=Tanacetum coccineum TaxID=301880 RepID=A0ABQ4Y759_9ASTR